MIENVSIDFESLNPELASNLKRNMNRLNESNIAIRRQASKEILNIISTQQLNPSTFQEIAQLYMKSLLKAFNDDSEVVRETSVKTVIELLSRCEEINQFLPYILSVLVERTNCVDLQGIANLPEVMRPPPGQKPRVVVRLQEQSEEVRMLYCKLIQKLLGLTDVEVIRNHLDDIINIIRTFVMDPCGDIQKQGCETLQMLCKAYKNILLNYTQTMGKAILLPLISKKSKIRIAALEALNSIFKCGLWKFNAFVFEDLIGFRDPNSILIKDFYSPTTNVNYLATLIIDPNTRVREAFMKCLHEWICVLEDKYDHHGKLVPYVLSGLFDEDPNIRKIAYDTIEQIGQQIQVEKEKEFRENRQFGVDAAWTWDGKMNNMPLIDPFISRPRLGSRFFVRGHIRKLWPALFRQIQDINIENRLRAVKLALMGVIYAENHMTTHMDKFIPPFITAISSPNKEDAPICQIVSTIFYYLGRFCEYSSYIHIIKSGIKGQLVQNPEFIKCTFKALAKLTEGNLQCVPKDTGLSHKKGNVFDTLNMLTEFQLFNEISSHNCSVVEEFINAILNGLKKSANEQELNEIMDNYFVEITKVIFIIFYEKYLGTALLTSTHNINLKLPEVQPSFDFVKEQSIKRKHLFDEFLNQLFRNPPSFIDSNWKFIIIYYIYLLKVEADSSQVDTVLDVICESLQCNRLPQMTDSTLKVVIVLLNDPIFSKNDKITSVYKLITSCGENLLKYRPIKKLPRYMETDNKDQKQQNTDEIKIPDHVFHSIFQHLALSLEALTVKNIQLNEQQSAGLIYCFVWSTAKIRKEKELIHRSVRVVWTFLQRVDTKTWSADKFKYEGKYVLPVVIDFLIERIETMESGTQYSNLVLGALIRAAQLFPNCQVKMVPLPYHCPNYPDILERLFKYALDEKDAETKNKFSELLLALCKKMTQWFKVELEMARSKGRFERQKLLQSVLAYCHK